MIPLALCDALAVRPELSLNHDRSVELFAELLPYDAPPEECLKANSG